MYWEYWGLRVSALELTDDEARMIRRLRMLPARDQRLFQKSVDVWLKTSGELILKEFQQGESNTHAAK